MTRKDGSTGPEFDDDSVVELDPDEALEFLQKQGDEPPSEVDPEDDDDLLEIGVEPLGPPHEVEVGADASDDEADEPAESSAVLEAVAEAQKAYESTESVELDHEAPRIPGYRIEGVIGRGATGIVYRARQLAVDRHIALKVMHPELITNRRAVRRLKREARLAAKLAHPSIISAIDMGEVGGGLWWYAMELVEGIPLSRRIKERTQLSERECLRLFSPLCDALQHAHEVGVVHRDIKPANILLDTRGRARLVDLGLAMGHNDPSITKTGSTLGTPHYVSPEQARDPTQADIRSDLWSLGATMYHAVCGRPPFYAEAAEDGGVAEILSRVLYEPIVDPREYAPSISRGFALMLRKCLTRDPDRRYQEPWELVADIELLRERRRLDVSGSQLDAYASRNPEWIRPFSITLGLVGLVVGTWAITAKPWEERPEVKPEERSVTYADWPELDAIRIGVDEGTMSLAEAIAELDSPTLEAVDTAHGFLENELVVRVKEQLDQRVTDWMQDATSRVDAALEERRFADASAALDDTLLDRLRDTTGYVEPDELPPGKSKRRATTWLKGERERVRSSIREAVRTAINELEDAYPSIVGSRVDALVSEHRWLDAFEWLSEERQSEWERRLDGVVRFDGLDAAQRTEVLDTITADLRSDRSEVRRLAAHVLDESRDYINAERERWLAEIESAPVDGELGAADRFVASVAAKNESLRLDLEQLPDGEGARHRARVEAVRDEIALAEAQRFATVASEALSQLEILVDRHLSRREYESARARLEAAKADAWRESTFPVIDARLREVGILEDVLVRAAEGILAAHGDTRELRFSSLPMRGRVRSNAGDVLRRGFRFRQEFGQRDVIDFVLSREAAVAFLGDDLSQARLLETVDVLRFAGLSSGEGRSADDDLAAAAFLLAEGYPAESRARLRLEEHPAGDALPSMLESRARREITERREAGSDVDDGGSVSTAPVGRTAATILSEFGTPNQTSLSRDVRLVWRFARDNERPDGLTRPIPTGDDRAGSWRAHHWVLTPLGYALEAPLAGRTDVMRDDSGPILHLGPPINNDRSATVRVEVVPGDGRPLGHLFAISIRGHHALFHGGYVWFGTGSLRELYSHVDTGSKDKFEGFVVAECQPFKDGEAMKISIEMNTGRLARMTQNGERIHLTQFFTEPERVDPYVRIRSRGPMTLREAELRAVREPGGR